jgi:hypothetical protein
MKGEYAMTRTCTSVCIILFVGLALISCRTTPATTTADYLVNISRGASTYDGGKIIIGEIDGYPEAVGLLKSSLINALMGQYTADPGKASYTLSGSIYAKRYWRKGRPYIYHTLDLRLIDKEGSVLITMHNNKPIWQAQLRDFSMQVVAAIK